MDPEEQERRELAAAAAELEESRIAALKEKCAKKGLDFDTENQKYLNKRMKKEKKRKIRQTGRSSLCDCRWFLIAGFRVGSILYEGFA